MSSNFQNLLRLPNNGKSDLIIKLPSYRIFVVHRQNDEQAFYQFHLYELIHFLLIPFNQSLVNIHLIFCLGIKNQLYHFQESSKLTDLIHLRESIPRQFGHFNRLMVSTLPREYNIYAYVCTYTRLRCIY